MAKSEQSCPRRNPWSVVHSHDKSENGKFQNARSTLPSCPRAPNHFSRIPCFNSQTRNAARINRFVRAIVPIPGSTGSSDSASISRKLFRFGRRLGATSEDLPPKVTVSGGFLLPVRWFMINHAPGGPWRSLNPIIRSADAASQNTTSPPLVPIACQKNGAVL